ncbi:hypothetical protein K1T71_010377 [Dendrolimus kikuchii]|uniref:Uncharacterized protein n=1 Tax=Dendrolimus kikuchii TaxID=765133 RepID=A0ACC1CRS5_9NEOP|nr:hypothetical protein K1T71_010377 [Dendrolimus kikuchii]
MKAILIFCFVVLAMALAQEVVITNPDPAFSQPSQPPSGGAEPILIDNPDSAFYRPSQPPSGQSNSGGRPYPPKQYDNPLARGGK